MTGCGHCEELQPHWNNAVKANKTSIEMADYEQGTEEGKNLCEKHNVNAFPTMLFIDGQNKANQVAQKTINDVYDIVGLHRNEA